MNSARSDPLPPKQEIPTMPKISVNFPPNKPQPAVRSWSEYQEAIFDFVEQPGGNAIIEAVAGSGKTTTIVEATRRVRRSTIFLAFNKAIAEELKQRKVNARTFHSLCFGPSMQRSGAKNPEPKKLRLLVESKFNVEQEEMYGFFAQRLVGYARGVGIGTKLLEDTVENWMALIDHHELELDHPSATIEEAIRFAQYLLEECNNSFDPVLPKATGGPVSRPQGLVDFDDMLYQVVRLNLPLPKFDWVFVDEAQDTNPVQRDILRRILKPTGRLVAVGDPAQAIYGFRGADSESLGNVAKEFRAVTLPLSVSYRCPRTVVEHARRWVSHIQPAPNAAEGSVSDLGTNWTTDLFQPEDLVVCRTSKPIISLAFSMLRARKPVVILGRDLQEGLKSTVKKMRAANIDKLQLKLESFAKREIDKANSKKEEAKAASIADRVSALLVLIEGLPETERTIPELLRTIDALFADGVGKTTLCTIHKSKGLEAKRVIWMNPWPSAWATRDWQVQQERNLCYVATTRAIESLVLIAEQKKK